MRKMGLLAVLFALSIQAPSAMAKESTAYFAGGCFWGVEYYLEQQEGVKSVVSGFMGGFVKDPNYKEVVYTKTGHIETVAVTYDDGKISFEALSKVFFEIHDFTQVDGQGPDIGERYESYIFYNDASEKKITQSLIKFLSHKGYEIGRAHV